MNSKCVPQLKQNEPFIIQFNTHSDIWKTWVVNWNYYGRRILNKKQSFKYKVSTHKFYYQNILTSDHCYQVLCFKAINNTHHTIFNSFYKFQNNRQQKHFYFFLSKKKTRTQRTWTVTIMLKKKINQDPPTNFSRFYSSILFALMFRL